MASHGPVKANWTQKQQHYDGILRNLERIVREDEATAQQDKERASLFLVQPKMVWNTCLQPHSCSTASALEATLGVEAAHQRF
jgi:hypothetical protein